MSGDEEQYSWVAIGPVDVEPGQLSGPGGSWDEVIPGDVEDLIDPDIRVLLPTDGWREVIVRSPAPAVRRTFAAPAKPDNGWSNEGDWVLAYVSQVVGETPKLWADASGGPLRPGQPSRRRGLRLHWTGPHVLSAAALSSLTVTLTNDSSDVVWVSDPGDFGYALGWLIDAVGERHGSPFFVSAMGQTLPTLAPGGSATIPLALNFERDTPMPAGSYRLESVLPALNLHGEPADIEVAYEPAARDALGETTTGGDSAAVKASATPSPTGGHAAAEPPVDSGLVGRPDGFEPVRRSEVNLLPWGPFGDFVELTIKLSGDIDAPGWRICYEGWRGNDGLTGPEELMVRPPTIDPFFGVQLFCRESQVEAYVRYVDDRVQMANRLLAQPDPKTDPAVAARSADDAVDALMRRRARLEELASQIPPPGQ